MYLFGEGWDPDKADTLSFAVIRRPAAACGHCKGLAMKPKIMLFDEPTSALGS